MIKVIIFDFNKTLFDPEKGGLYPGAKSLVVGLSKKHILALVSYGGKKRKSQLKKTGLEFYFRNIVLTEQKGEKDYLRAIEGLTKKHEEVLVVGDKLEEEIRIGKSLGMKTLWLENHDYGILKKTLGESRL